MRPFCGTSASAMGAIVAVHLTMTILRSRSLSANTRITTRKKPEDSLPSLRKASVRKFFLTEAAMQINALALRRWRRVFAYARAPRSGADHHVQRVQARSSMEYLASIKSDRFARIIVSVRVVQPVQEILL